MNHLNDLFDYIAHSPSPFHAVAHTAERLEQAGFTRLQENQPWNLVPRGRYFVTRNQSSLIAFVLPERAGASWRMSAAHSDSPSFRVKSASHKQGFTMLDTEGYGGMIRSSWMDRPLGVAGRVLVSRDGAVESRLVDLGGSAAVIPHLAIHLDREVNQGHNYDLKKDMQAIFQLGQDKDAFQRALAEKAGCQVQEILSTDLYLYCPQPGMQVNGELVLCPRLDDLACAWAALEGILQQENPSAGHIYCLFDNEEVGSGTRQGACSDFLPQVLARIAQQQGLSVQEQAASLAGSLLLSADNGHAIHPNFAEMSDPTHPVELGKGVVLKFSASQKYTTNAVTAALLNRVASENGVTLQHFYNRADLPGGSTLGNLLAAQVSVPMADVGLPQLAMHASVETAAAGDVYGLWKLCCGWHQAEIHCTGDAGYQVKFV